MNSIEEFCPIDKADWRNWLKQNHNQKKAVWLILHKKNSPGFNLSWSEAVDEALCFGWIDSTKNSIDLDSYKQYFTKRKPKSNWSKVNKDKVKILIDNGLMEKEGYKSIAIAKENGSWTILDSVEELIVPDDLQKVLADDKNSMEYFDGLSKSDKKGLLYWVVSAKRSETRQKRINEIAENARCHSKPKHFR